VTPEPKNKPAVGDVVRLPDSLTGFSDDPEKVRWCVVVVDLGFSMRVMPRSKTSTDGVFVPADAMPEFTEDGRIFDKFRSIPLSSFDGAPNIGRLPDEYLKPVLALAHRRRGGRRGGAA
jgi:hypothetical protein